MVVVVGGGSGGGETMYQVQEERAKLNLKVPPLAT